LIRDELPERKKFYGRGGTLKRGLGILAKNKRSQRSSTTSKAQVFFNWGALVGEKNPQFWRVNEVERGERGVKGKEVIYEQGG